MKAILISIKPEWVYKILYGKKTLEVRKTKPKCELPIKVYIYCTKDDSNMISMEYESIAYYRDWKREYDGYPPKMANGYVIAEFTLNEIEVIKSIREISNGAHRQYHKLNDRILKQSCLSEEQILDYTNGNDLYGWHIDNLKVYDEPKELSIFRKRNKCHYANYEDGCCFECCTFYDLGECDGQYSKIERPPQSYMFVEDLDEI